MSSKMLDKITYPLSNFNGATMKFENEQVISNSYFVMDVIFYPYT